MEITDEEIKIIESVANGLRGMTMDQQISNEPRSFLGEQALRLDAITDRLNGEAA